MGRPRRVTDADVAAILAWQAARETQRQLARRLGLSVRTVSHVIRTRGSHYKTPSPDADPDPDPMHRTPLEGSQTQLTGAD